MKLALLCYSVAISVVCAFLAFTVLSDPIPRFQRFKDGDNVQGNGELRIVCTAYSNRPNQDFTQTHPGEYYGLRIVSDCLTERP